MVRHVSKLHGRALGALAVLAIAGISACSEKHYAVPTPAAGGPNDRPAASAVRSDADIAAVTSALNAGEIEQAEIARTKARAPDVQSFATHMIADHSDAQRRQTALFNGLGIKPLENDVSRALTAEAGAVTTSLREEAAGAFDAAYMDSQVKMHQRGLQVLETQLIPLAERPEVRAELQRTRDAVAHHLAQAQTLRASLETPDKGSPQQDGR